jgi:hypothetical protein
MLINDILEEQKLFRARVQPNLWFVPFSIAAMLQEIRDRHFPHLTKAIDIYAVSRGSLACIVNSAGRATICIHQILNHGDTPAEVISYVCKHELLHLQIGAAEVNGRKTVHPPEFWEAEKRIAPERVVAWTWILVSLGQCIKRRPKLERIDVKPNWRKLWAFAKVSLERTVAICSTEGTMKPEESGW